MLVVIASGFRAIGVRGFRVCKRVLGEIYC